MNFDLKSSCNTTFQLFVLVFFFFFFFDPISLSEQILYAEDVCFEKACHQFHHLLLHFHPSCCPNIFTKNRQKARYILTVHAAPNFDKNVYCSEFYSSTHSVIWMKKLSTLWLPSHLYLYLLDMKNWKHSSRIFYCIFFDVKKITKFSNDLLRKINIFVNELFIYLL